MGQLRTTWICLFSLSLIIEPGFAFADNWPNWRGPNENGSSREKGVPVLWGGSSGVAWKCPLPGWGTSTPVIWDRAVFVTSQIDEKKLVVCRIDKATGRLEWVKEVGSAEPPRPANLGPTQEDRGRQRFHTTQNMASPSPVTDGRVVVVHFGNGDLAAYDYGGECLWHRNLQKEHGEYSIWWGHANSPVLFDDLVICACMQDSLVDLGKPPSPSYLVAYDKQTGALRWKTLRMTAAVAESCDAYTTPIFRRHGGRTEMIVMGGLMLDAYDPATGRQIWGLPGLDGNRVITGPVLAGDMIIATQGMRKPTIAVRPGGTGVRTTSDIVWEEKDAAPDSPTPAVDAGRLYFISDNGIVRCLDAGTGKLHWKERLRGQYRASPLVADGKVYFLNMEGVCTVASAAERFEGLAENRLDDTTIASPAVSERRLFLRGKKHLYCVKPE